jgi:hypothetical protein
MSLLGRLRQARADLDAREDPWRAILQRALHGVESIGSVALLDLLGAPVNTGTARRLAENMRALGFVPIKSRRLLPGGFRDTVTRGWTRPVRESPRRTQDGEIGERVQVFHADTVMSTGTS